MKQKATFTTLSKIYFGKEPPRKYPDNIALNIKNKPVERLKTKKT